LEKGTAFITDIGMCGPKDSVLGVKKEIIIERFLTQLPQSHKVALGDSILNAVEISIDIKTKKATKIKRISEIYHH
jgi:calcineurin-like phosphoesterase